MGKRGQFWVGIFTVVEHVGKSKMKLSILLKTRDITLNTILDMETRTYQLFLPC